MEQSLALCMYSTTVRTTVRTSIIPSLGYFLYHFSAQHRIIFSCSPSPIASYCSTYENLVPSLVSNPIVSPTSSPLSPAALSCLENRINEVIGLLPFIQWKGVKTWEICHMEIKTLSKVKSLTWVAPAMLQNNKKEHTCFHCSTENSMQTTYWIYVQKEGCKNIKFWHANFFLYFCAHICHRHCRFGRGTSYLVQSRCV